MWEPSEHGRGQRSFQRRVARGLTWTFIDNWGSQFIGLLIFAILARILTDVDFGVVALAIVFVSFAELIVDQGLGDALIQRKVITRSHIDTAFWVAVATAVVLTVAGIVLSGPLAVLVNEPAVGPIIAVLSLNFIITSLSSVQMALLRREMAFRSLAARRIAAIVVGGAAGVIAAIYGLGAWALVVQQLVYGVVSVITLWAVSPWRPRLHASRAEFRELFSFGINIVGSDLLGFLGRNVDNLLIGAFLGAGPLGLYAVGFRLLETTQKVLVNVARKLAFPVFSKLQGEPERMRRAYGRANRVLSAIILPGYVGLAVVAQETVVLLFGARWTDSGPVAATLFLIGPVLTVQAFSGSLLNAAGHPRITFRFRLLSTIVHVAGFAIAIALFGNIVAVAAAFVISSYLLLPLNLYLQQRYAGVSAVGHLMDLRWLALATVVMALAMLGVKFLLADRFDVGVILAAEVVTGLVVYAVTLLLFERQLFKDMLTVAAQAIPGGKRLARAAHLPVESRGGRRRRREQRREEPHEQPDENDDDQTDDELLPDEDMEPTDRPGTAIDPSVGRERDP